MKTILAFVLALLVTSSVSQAQNGTKAAAFSLKDSKGKTVDLAALKGKAVVVNFWATWCGPCKSEIPGFLKVYDKYKKQGFEIVGISLDQKGWDAVKPFIEKYKLSYPVVIDDGSIAAKYGDIRSIPTSFFIDRKGNITDSHVGYMSEQDFEAKVKKLL